MTSGFDFLKMFDEIKAVREKYNLPKGVWFVPDRLEISVQRVSYGSFHLSYREFFNYLPSQIIEMVMPTSISCLIQMGIPREHIRRTGKNAVEVKLDGDLLSIASVIFTEFLLQRRFDEETEISSFLDIVKRVRKGFVEFSDLEFEWNGEIEKRFYGNLDKLLRVVQENPSAMAEIEAVVKKHTQPSETPKSDETENKPEP